MNPLLNPFISLPLLKSTLIDRKRLGYSTPEQIQRYKDKSLKKMLNYAKTIPLYHDIYKKAGIRPRDIHGITDIDKIPMISKHDVTSYYPDRLLPSLSKKKHSHIVCTGGTTGKPLCIYTDFYTIGISATLTLRQLDLLGLPSKNLKMVHIGNFNPYRIDMVVRDHFHPHIKSFAKTDNILNIDVNTPFREIMAQLNEFKPDVIMTYPATFQYLASLKRNGEGPQIKPLLCWTGGAMLDTYTRASVEDAFNCRLLNIYPSVEAHGDIAFECRHGTWHIHDDFYHLEAIDDDGQLVGPGERGHIVISRLWGRGTPIIRYNGMDDWVRLGEPQLCECGLNTHVILGGVEGRKRANIVLPNGKVFPPGAFCFITPVLNNLNTFKVKQYQIVQEKIDLIHIYLVIDEHQRDTPPPVDLIKDHIKEAYEKKVGPGVTIIVKEVDSISHPTNARKPPPIVISKVKQE